MRANLCPLIRKDESQQTRTPPDVRAAFLCITLTAGRDNCRNQPYHKLSARDKRPSEFSRANRCFSAGVAALRLRAETAPMHKSGTC
jgi:hypothetical protein